jgi:hypothetical protein
MNNIILSVNKILKKNYPIEITFDKIYDLSHFHISSNDWNRFLPFNFNIDGQIFNGEYINYKIIRVFTDEIYNWNKYILLYVSFINKCYNPCIDQNKFLYLLHTYNLLTFLNIKKIYIQKNNELIEVKINYINKTKLLLNNLSININQKKNHFYFDSFSVNNNYLKLKSEIDRLIANRDSYNSIHFHLDNNAGGDIVPAHIILRCLVGKKEKWMKNIKKIIKNKEIVEWDCWQEEKYNSPNYNVVKKLNLNFLPNYETKYNGKIYLYMTNQNGSAAWFFITYLIYAFAIKINRYSKKCYGKNIKFGSIESNQLILKDLSGTTSGDGNPIVIELNKDIKISCPTQQFLSCSIKKSDWNRFWCK